MPKESYLKTVKRILRYLKHTSDLALWYPKGCNFDLVGYADADYASFLVHRKSTSGMAHFLGPCLYLGNQKTTLCCHVHSRSRICCCCFLLCSVIVDKATLKGFCISTGCIPIYCDNTSAINISKNPCQHKRTKPIDMRRHFLRDNVEKGLISMNLRATNKQIADIFTKALSREQFKRNILELGLITIT